MCLFLQFLAFRVQDESQKYCKVGCSKLKKQLIGRMGYGREQTGIDTVEK